MPAPQIYNRRKIGSLVYASNAQATLELQRGDVLAGLNFRLKYTVTNGASAAVGPLKQTLARLLKRIEVNVNGRDTPISIRGDSLAARVAYERGIAALGMDASVVLTGSAATTYDIVLPLDFTLPRGRKPDDTALDLRGISQAIVKVTWGPSDCSDFYAQPNSAAISSVTCSVEADYLLNAVDDAGKPKAYAVRCLDQTEKDLAGTSSAFDITVDNNTNVLMRSLFVEATADNVGSDSIINAAKLLSGSIVFVESDGQHIKGKNKADFRLAPTAGDYMFFLPFLGQSPYLINTGALPAELRHSFDATKISGTNTFRVTREYVRPLMLA